MRRIRTALFWVHLAGGVTAGLVIAVMAVTGAAMAFQPQVLAWAERETAQVAPPAGVPPLTIDALMARLRADHPEARLATLTLSADPTVAVRATTGREGGFHIDPYTGAARPLGGERWRATFQFLLGLHRWLGMTEAHRPWGAAITGATATIFLLLALSGLWLWWPRKWTARALRPSIWFRRGLTGRARDWSWHNVIGFWSLPVLLVITSSGVVMAYRWATRAVYALAGEAPPAEAGPPDVTPKAEGARPLPLEALVGAARREVPGWQTLTLRLRAGRGNGDERRARGGPPAAVSVAIKEAGAWPRFATTQLWLDPFTARILREERYRDAGPGRRARSWLRFLHTGEALGWPGQLAVGLAALAAAVMVYTGLALAWRRLRASAVWLRLAGAVARAKTPRP